MIFDRTPWKNDRPVERCLPKQNETNTKCQVYTHAKSDVWTHDSSGRAAEDTAYAVRTSLLVRWSAILGRLRLNTFCFSCWCTFIRAQWAIKRSKLHSAEVFDSVASISFSLPALTLEFLKQHVHSLSIFALSFLLEVTQAEMLDICGI